QSKIHNPKSKIRGHMAYAWIVWLVLATIFVGIEALTPGFFLLWFGVGALVASIMAMLGIGSIGAQIIVFLVVSVLLLVTSRNLLERFFHRGETPNRLITGVETMVGQIGTVVESSDGALNQAAVKVYGSVWMAFPTEGESPLKAGETVAIDRVDGNVIYVHRKSHHPHLFGETSENT
ncbi:MAG: NfeD family protein, partial [Acidobacteriota bacterium]